MVDLERILKVAREAPQYADELVAMVEKLRRRMDELEQAGMIRAQPYWEHGRYLLVVYPSKDGKRERVYVGCDQAKQQEYLPGIRRWEEYQNLAGQLQVLENAIKDGAFYLDNFGRVVSSLPRG